MTPLVTEQADAFARGEVTAEALATQALARLEALAPLNALGALTPDTALEVARALDRARSRGDRLGPLAGVPLAHKDLFYRAGRPCHCGSVIRAGFVPETTATVLSRLDAAGAVDLGTLHMAEFAMSPTGFNAHYGHGRNPWNPAHVCGGSSSGSGIAVAAGAVAASLGSDTGGSIRHPAAACGVTGLKPTHGAVSLAGAMPLSASLDTVGPLARSARDAARIMDAIAGPDALDPTTAGTPRLAHEAALTGDARGLRLAVPRGWYAEDCDAEIAAVLAEALRALGSAGLARTETGTPDMAPIHSAGHVLLTTEAAALHRRWLLERPQDYGDQVRARFEPGLLYPATAYVEALARRGALAAEWIATAMGDADAAFLPVFPCPVPTIAETTDGGPAAVAAAVARLTRNTRAINYLGLPAVSVPCGVSASGLPVAFQLVGRPWSEPLLLRIADAFQRLTDWHRRTPETACPAPA
jgi:aspartyl-tRNA(Asn)/glutamyl-tRNA(Gln) amidotransferase subunit A